MAVAALTAAVLYDDKTHLNCSGGDIHCSRRILAGKMHSGIRRSERERAPFALAWEVGYFFLIRAGCLA